jgi:hypothetical protein
MVPINNTANGSNLLGNNLNQIIGTGNSETEGYRSQQVTSTSGSSLNLTWRVDIPSPGSLGPFALGRGNSTILFTATSDSVYTAAGDNFFGNGNINTLFNYKLRDLTNSVDLVSFSDGWINSNGTQVTTTTGSLTGTLIAGRQYSWTSDYEASKYGFEPNQFITATGNASLNLTPAAIPEPSTVVLLGLAALGMFTWRRVR